MILQTFTCNAAPQEQWHDWPDVGFPDIYSYLIAAPSPYGWIEKVQVMAIRTRPSTVFVHARIRHSQRITATPLKPLIERILIHHQMLLFVVSILLEG